ncbi:MAG: hypothetical protein JWM47_1438 [Acidimicrobiales bacterium]|nr:hypothetical protein [Acidimicrobiales bacterium]
MLTWRLLGILPPGPATLAGPTAVAEPGWDRRRGLAADRPAGRRTPAVAGSPSVPTVTYAQPMADPTAVVGRRIGAFAIDSILMLLVTIAVLVPMFLSSSETLSSDRYRCENTASGTGTSSSEDRRVLVPSSICVEAGDEIRYIPENETGSFTASFYGIGFGLQVLNLVLLQGLTGASIGKLMLGLRVVRQDGQKAGIGWAFLRWVLLFVDQICCFLPGAILVFTTKGHRRIGDMVAGTFVIRKDQAGRPVAVPGVTTGYGTPGYSTHGYPSQPGYGQPPSGAWAPPAGPQGPSPSDPTPAGAAAPGEGPTWDAARNAYIQYDRELSAWVQWSDAAGAWLPIDQ